LSYGFYKAGFEEGECQSRRSYCSDSRCSQSYYSEVFKIMWPSIKQLLTKMGVLQNRGFVWVLLTKDRFQVGEYNKLVARKVGSLEIIEKTNPNAYWLKLPSYVKTSYAFTVKHLVPYMEILIR
jgi:hypothetical protein